MQTSNLVHTRLGALVLGLSALLFFASPLFTPYDPSYGPVALLEQTGGLFIIAMTLFPLGMLAVYAQLAHQHGRGWAGVALICQLVALGPLQAFAGLDTFAMSTLRRLYFQEGNQEFMRVQGEIMLRAGGPSFSGIYSLLLLGMALLDVGMIILAVVIWRSGILSKWAGVLYALGFVLFVVAVFTPAGHIVRVIDAALGGVGGMWLAWSLWQHKPASAG